MACRTFQDLLFLYSDDECSYHMTILAMEPLLVRNRYPFRQGDPIHIREAILGFETISTVYK
ncbi:hypothetical protein I3842_06G009100 [Carya illinoinensis]|uniref:Uncharacterized protein n=1 Tax=Carya illinoinensis TaxID=32201 RepID=A0A922JFS0_CARIL|nr:hypothetical protein I3842_06G009100 [Carya illinoinensis]